MFIKNTILEELKHVPTGSQIVASEEFVNFLEDREKYSVFILTGYAGTGKTSLISALIKTCDFLKKPTILMAPTGRAAKVLGLYSGKNANTIHKTIYRKQSTKDSDSGFVLDFRKKSNIVFIVDEASMISNINTGREVFGSGRLLDDLLQYVYNNDACKLILVGDPAQLPPVGTNLSPALDKNYLASLGFKTYTSELKEVVRQADESGILANATMLRDYIYQDKYSEIPNLNINKYPDIIRISGSELINEIESSYSRCGIEETRIITRSNYFANRYNQGIRSQILWREEEISIGDILMITKNNYSNLGDDAPIDFIANGDIVEVKRVGSTQEIFGYRFVDLLVVFQDYPEFELDIKVVLESLTVSGASMPEDYYKTLYNELALDYEHISDSRKRHEAILDDSFFNALQVKFAYAITCHKSQGGQWKTVFIDHGVLQNAVIDADFYRWLYTAVTRATERLYLVNFSKEFFGE
jgi:exodeoxyribonuclease V